MREELLYEKEQAELKELQKQLEVEADSVAAVDVELRKVSKEVEEAKQETEALRKVGSQIDELFEGVRRGRQLEKKDREQLNEEVE